MKSLVGYSLARPNEFPLIVSASITKLCQSRFSLFAPAFRKIVKSTTSERTTLVPLNESETKFSHKKAHVLIQEGGKPPQSFELPTTAWSSATAAGSDGSSSSDSLEWRQQQQREQRQQQYPGSRKQLCQLSTKVRQLGKQLEEQLRPDKGCPPGSRTSPAKPRTS